MWPPEKPALLSTTLFLLFHRTNSDRQAGEGLRNGGREACKVARPTAGTDEKKKGETRRKKSKP